MKKTIIAISVVLALLMVLPLATFASKNGGSQFSDVKSGKWYCGDVKKVSEAGLMNGVSATEFDPNGTLTRGMCATILYRAAAEPAVNGGSSFADVKDGKYYSEAVAWAENSGVVNGKTAVSFDPNGNITREEFATMLYRFLDAEELDLPATREGTPTDADSVAKFAKTAVNAMYRGEVVNGRENGEFDPDADITRAEAAAMIGRFLDRVTVRWEFGREYAWIGFTEGEEGYFYGVDINDLAVGYVPEGLVLCDEVKIDDDAFAGKVRLLVLCDPNELDPEHEVNPPFIILYIRAYEDLWGFSDEEMEMTGMTTINGMAAVKWNTVFDNQGESLEAGKIVFGDRNISVNVQYIGVAQEEAIKVAESLTVALAG